MSAEAPVKITVTDATGQICCSLPFRVASGSLLDDQPIELRLLEITPALRALEDVVMELDDCALPSLKNVVIGDDPKEVFDGVNLAMLVGAMPRKAGMERDDLLSTNGTIFTAQDKTLNEVAADDVHMLMTDDPASTDTLIASSNALDIPKERFNALTRLDHNHAKSQLAQKLGCPAKETKKMTVWSDHSSTQYPGIFHAEVGERNVTGLVNGEAWIESTFVPTVARRSAVIVEARGLSSAASATNATVEHMRDWVFGAPDGDWVSVAIPSDGSYGVAEGVISSFPYVVKNGKYEIVQGLEIGPFSRTEIDTPVTELLDEREAVKEFSLI